MSALYLSNVCLPCRLKLVAALRSKSTSRRYFGLLGTSHKIARPRPTIRPLRLLPYPRHVSTEKSSASVKKDDIGEESMEVSEDLQDGEVEEQVNLEDIRKTFDAETIAVETRKRFGDRVPQDLLNEDESKIYERLFGQPIYQSAEDQEAQVEANQADDDYREVLLKEGQSGKLEEVVLDTTAEDTPEDAKSHIREGESALDAEQALGPNATAADAQLQRDIASGFAGTPQEQEQEEEHIAHVAGEELRAHPFTLSGRSGTNPSTIQFPKSTFTGPVSVILGETNNKHLTETAQRVMGGPGLPYSTGTPRKSRTMAQKPIPLSPFQTKMQPIEADVYLGTLMPGLYASISSIVVECRRRLGTQWLRRLFEKEGGPSILDVGAGGAGVLAWREILQAEWKRICDEDPEGSSDGKHREIPWGKATVLTSSDALRHHSSILLEDTTFLPRLPDYVHIRQDNPQRKSFDIIVASHNLWPLSEEYMRRQHVQNLWSMTNPHGGILILQEKGVPRGFEALASARQFLLDELMLPTASDTADAEGAEDAATVSSISEDDPSSSKAHRLFRDDGTIIAPCTTHTTCPMYHVPGLSRQRKDYCHFSQRYTRPSFQQNILGGKSRNHEDVEFSYVAVQRGTKPEDLGLPLPHASQVRQDGNTAAELGARLTMTGKEATDRAFDGYDIHDPDLAIQLPSNQQMASTVTASGVQASFQETTNPAPSAKSPAPTNTTNYNDSNHRPTSPTEAPPQHTTLTSPIQESNNHVQEANEPSSNILTTPPPPHEPPNPLTLPRLISPPLKRHGHVILDCCTPAGTLERWTVPRSFGKQAYRDARKARWGDLWALGAKFRRGKDVRVGMRGKGEGRDAKKVEQEEEDGDERGREGGGELEGDADGDAGESDGADARPARKGKVRKQLRGREKARSRKREERKKMVENAARKRGSLDTLEA
ncbi:MAG: 37S ribosomal protein S22 [Alyxoria varia]|nr:MAG: 37S ribosomal protein S22 [Alyxoria varia]